MPTLTAPEAAALDDGGPAFPCAPFVPGMPLRDYFAAKAMGAIVSDPSSATLSTRQIAVAAYDFADAMLIARAAKAEGRA